MKPVTVFGPDFPFAYDDWISHPSGIGSLPASALGSKVAIIGSGAAGVIAGYELMKLGLQPILFESGQFGGRLRSQPFEGVEGVIAELGGMRFPVSSTGFYHYVNLLGLESAPFPNPLTPAAGSTVIDLLGKTHYAKTLADLPPLFSEVAHAYATALEEGANFGALKQAIRHRDIPRIKEIWDPLVKAWDERTFYDFVASSEAFQKLSFHHREVFGQVGFGTGGWDSDFPNSMLEILRVNVTECDDHQRYIIGGVEQVPRKLWTHCPEKIAHWPSATSLAGLNGGATRSGASRIRRKSETTIEVTDKWGRADDFEAVLVTCQSHLLSTQIDTEETLFSQDLWMALDRTRFMQSAKTFVMVDRPFWKDKDPETGRDIMSMTLTDRMTRGTYLFDNGPDKPSVICLSYSWMTDALKVLPLPTDKRVELALSALNKIYPTLDIRSHILGDPITVSWEADENFLGAFKGALPGHYRYNHRMFGHFMQQNMPPEQQGIFIAGDGVSWTPAWVEGAVQTSLNAVSGIIHHFGGSSHADNPSPRDAYHAYGPVTLLN
ncbi:flavin monoamine oxidase family protein [Sulfitobacter guttiformis]|uniref:Tryptophan 2-monooxygenase n=1 Tax=Sulfitobacter guttiformis TaxID=74349 RepID=A0A420DP28_9RHOB|nr:NAD(P)/FAD-dependent oxidoreductase [Sulfitobacter guttiformis]KIN73290.1 Tryptophan monooxygenase [Sulfitobacter guttiformis KCTC 32187]RKE95960.1 lysine 2-monooxygenase [Sulfitobacter guttiformis]